MGSRLVKWKVEIEGFPGNGEETGILTKAILKSGDERVGTKPEIKFVTKFSTDTVSVKITNLPTWTFKIYSTLLIAICRAIEPMASGRKIHGTANLAPPEEKVFDLP